MIVTAQCDALFWADVAKIVRVKVRRTSGVEQLLTVARHNSLAKGYVAAAVKLIDQLKEMESSNE
ncbi:MAG: hypothetical protein HYR94_01485 [Chloroflexi bacterium]|nr:hypothetical protein [Chloroflexota bacterium]